MDIWKHGNWAVYNNVYTLCTHLFTSLLIVTVAFVADIVTSIVILIQNDQDITCNYSGHIVDFNYIIEFHQQYCYHLKQVGLAKMK